MKVGGMQDSIMEHFWSSSHISGGNAAYVEELYDTYLHNPNAVSEEWRNYFDQLPRVSGVLTQDTPHSVIRANSNSWVNPVHVRLSLLVLLLVRAPLVPSMSVSKLKSCN